MIPEHIQKDINKLANNFPLECHGGEPIKIIIKDFELPKGYKKEKSDLLINVPIAYPNAGLDMFWVDNDAIPSDKSWPFAVSIEEILGRKWFRYSWHPSQWTPGADNLLSYMEFVSIGIKKALQ